MPEYLAPGVYIEEIERGPKPIQGVATSTAAFLGETQRGPVRPRFITSYGAFLRLYGDVLDGGRYLPDAVRTFFDNGGRRCYVARIVGAGADTATAELDGFTFTALGPGAIANQTWVRIGPGSTLGPGGRAIGFRLRVDYWANPAEVPADAASIPTAATPTVSEDFDDLSIDPASTTYYDKIVNNFNSSLIEVTAPPDVALPAADNAAQLAGGVDGGPPTTVQYRGTAIDPNDRTGLDALDLDQYREVAIVHAPGVGYDIAREVIAHCERNRFRFAVVDAQRGLANVDNIIPRDNVQDTQFGAFYYPWIYVSDPRSGGRKLIPPGGATCGIYALTDNTRGVFKAPANETVAGAIDLEYDIDQGTQEVLNPRGANAIRRFPGRGIRVWGARTMSSDPLWKYVNVRRLFIFLEASIYQSTQWVVFEPNDQRLWNRVKQTVTLFLRTQWREGALMGAKEEEAFSVTVDRSTMTEDDILNGRLIIEVGVAPVRPAEFVIFRIFQKTQEAKS
jgi:phage tail sheath protein FI